MRGPAGPTRGERAAERGREADRCSCDVRAGDAKAPVGNEDGGAVEERRGGGGGGGEARREETSAGVSCGCRDEMGPTLGSRGMDGKRRLPDGLFELLWDIPRAGVPVRDWGREFELERELEFDSFLEPIGDGVRVYGRERVGGISFFTTRGDDGFGGRLGVGAGG